MTDEKRKWVKPLLTEDEAANVNVAIELLSERGQESLAAVVAFVRDINMTDDSEAKKAAKENLINSFESKEVMVESLSTDEVARELQAIAGFAKLNSQISKVVAALSNQKEKSTRKKKTKLTEIRIGGAPYKVSVDYINELTEAGTPRAEMAKLILEHSDTEKITVEEF